jgi:ribonuclease VapC
MFVDASAIVAILGREPDWSDLVARLDAAATIVVSPVVVYESALAVPRIRSVSIDIAQRSVHKFLVSVGAEIMPIDSSVGDAAIAAFARFGKGRHPAALNMGDCFAYACARARGQPLFCKGDDFARTDALLA